ncbi:MAG: hypothetical protein JWR51_3311 [Devosia sp.]|uniref:hypothetical protein n=1 Tax=Devosia sp. TaxID=1871048 RepID=UPI002636A8C2|nr:hypothetical protein [Devosia sp.]MDB5530208.1 hypothetical protein [Devosia sp.]
MRGIHFLTSDGLDFVGFSDSARATCCADLPLPGDYVGFAEDLDPESSMRKLPYEQQRLVEGKVLKVTDIWITVDRHGETGVWWYRYEFEGIEGKFRGDAFIDARFDRYAIGVLLSVDSELWFVPVHGTINPMSGNFCRPILIDGLERPARHQLLGSFRLGEDASAAFADFAKARDIEPVWGKATFVSSDDQVRLLAIEDWECTDPDAISGAIYAVEQSQMAPGW